MTCLKLNNDYYEALARDKRLQQRTRRKFSSLSYYACFKQESSGVNVPAYSALGKTRFSGSYSLSSDTRTYDSKTAKWLSRDHIQEDGGLNLYGFVGNDGVNNWDYLGYETWKQWTFKVVVAIFTTFYGDGSDGGDGGGNPVGLEKPIIESKKIKGKKKKPSGKPMVNIKNTSIKTITFTEQACATVAGAALVLKALIDRAMSPAMIFISPMIQQEYYLIEAEKYEMGECCPGKGRAV